MAGVGKMFSCLRTRTRKSQKKKEKNERSEEGENRSANCTVNKQPPLRCGGKIPPQLLQLAVHTLNIAITLYSFSVMNNSPLPPSIPLFWVSLPDQAAVGFLALRRRRHC